MQVTLAKADGLNRKLKIAVPSLEVETAYKKRLSEVSKTAKVDGFRPGKVPVKFLEERYGVSVRHEVIEKLIRDSLSKAVAQEKLKLAGPPAIEELKADPGQDLQYEADCEVYPEINLKELTGVEIEKVSAEITDRDMEEVLTKLREQRADWIEVKSAAKESQQVTMDFEGFMDDKPFEGGKAENVPLILGSNTMIPGFETGLVGVKAGDELEIKVTFPEKYHVEKLAGKPAIFKIKVHKVCEAKLPELSEEFAEKFGVKNGGVEKLKADIKKHMQFELNNAVKIRNKEQIFDKLLEQNLIELPKVLVEHEIKALHEMAHQQHHHDHDHDCSKISEEEKAQLQKPAERRVRLALLVNEVIKVKSLKVNAEKVSELINEMAGNYENAEEFSKWYYNDRQRLAQIEAMALEDQVIDELLKSAKVIAKRLSYK